MKKINWKNVIVIICLILSGCLIGVAVTLKVVNKKLSKYIEMKIDFFEEGM